MSSTERTAPLRSTHVRSGLLLLLLDPARGKERLMKIQQHDGVVVDAVVTCSRASPSICARGRGVAGEREEPGVQGAAAPPSPLYIGPLGGASPGDPISKGGGGQGG